MEEERTVMRVRLSSASIEREFSFDIKSYKIYGLKVEALRQTVGVDLEDPATVNGVLYYVQGLIDQLQVML